MVEALCTAARLAAVRLNASLCVEYITPAARAMLQPQHIAPGARWPGSLDSLGGLDLHEDLLRAFEDHSPQRREVVLDQDRAMQVSVQPCASSDGPPAAWVLFEDTSRDALTTMLRQALDALPAHVALLDRRGRIEWSNRAWGEFARHNGGEAASVGRGVNYLGCLERAGAGDASARRVGSALRSMLEGESEGFVDLYPCDGPSEQRWFMMQASPLPLPAGGALVAHHNVTGWLEHVERPRGTPVREVGATEPSSAAAQAPDGPLRGGAELKPGSISPGPTGPADLALPPPPDSASQHAEDTALAKVARHSEHWVLLTDARHRITWVNDSFVKGSGWSMQEARGRTPHDLLQVAVGAPQAPETLVKTKSGRPVVVQWDTHAVADDRGRVSSHAAVLKDLTQRRRHEEALRNSQAELGTIFSAAPDALVLLRRDGSVLRSNPSARRLFGLRDGESVSLRSRLVDAGHALLDRMLAEAVLGRVAQRSLSVCTPEGVQTPVSLRCVPVYRGGEVLRVLVVARDITEEQALRALSESRAAAEAASQAKTEFLARVSHELRTPLNAVLGFAQLLHGELGRAPVERLHLYLEQVRSAGAHLLALVTDLLDLACIENRTVHVTRGLTHVGDIVGQALAMVTPLSQQREVRLDWTPPAPAVLALIDPTRLTQVLVNLLSNAIKYGVPGGWARITCGNDGAPWIEVADSGVGVGALQREQLFEPFNRLGAERRGVEGTGIGLAISRELVRLMGGELTLVDRAGASTVFRVELPAVPPHTSDSLHDPSGNELRAAERPPTRQPDSACSPGLEHASERLVLYVEDDAVNTLLMECMFDAVPHWRLRVACSVEQGIELARQLRPDLILLDRQLPDGDGLAVREALMASDQTSAIPCILVTADASEAAHRKARELGVVDVQFKPLDLCKLKQRIALELEKR